jgi:hypothetical protein
VQAASFRVLPELATRVVKRVIDEPGVLSARWSTTTGSVVVEYEPRQVELPDLMHLIVKLGGLCGVEVDALSEERAAVRAGIFVRDVLARWNAAVGMWTRGGLDMKTGVPGAMAIGSLLMLALRRRQIPAWYDLAFWSFVTFCNLNREPIDDKRAG